MLRSNMRFLASGLHGQAYTGEKDGKVGCPKCSDWGSLRCFLVYCGQTAPRNLANPRGELGHLFESLSLQTTGIEMTRINLRKRLCLVLSSRCGLG
jgi:hypothetical protein